MDNRRFSIRAEVAGAGGRREPRDGAEPLVPFWDRAIELTRLNWELIAYVAIIIVAILTRVLDLESRAMHHDESIHAYFSNYYLKSGDYTNTPGFLGGYDPTYHGPFLYTMTAMAFYLFGTNEATARIMPAIFGVILVALCWLLRPFIGRWGAIIAAFLVTISPSITYYSRSLRHDIFALTGTMLLFVSILWFIRTHQAKWVYLGSLGLAIAFASHELTFIIAFMFALGLIVIGFIGPAFESRGGILGLLALVGAILFGGLGIFFVYASMHMGVQGNLVQLAGAAVCVILVVLLLAFLAWNARGYLAPRRLNGEAPNPVVSAGAALLTQRWTLLGGVLTFLAIYTVLFTNMLTKPDLWLTGFINGYQYWTSQQHVARGNQPEFYYFLLMFIYEPLAFFGGLGTIIYLCIKWLRVQAYEAMSFVAGLVALLFVVLRVALGSASAVDIVVGLAGLVAIGYPVYMWLSYGFSRAPYVEDTESFGDDTTAPAEPVDDYGVAMPLAPSVRGVALGFLAFWGVGAWVAFSLAGEKMPWLNMQIALPFTLLAAAGLGVMLNRIEWRQVVRGGGIFLGVAVVLFIFAAFMLVAHIQGVMPALPDSFQQTLRGILLVLFVLALMALCGWLAYKLQPTRALKVVALTFTVILVAYGVRSMVLSSFSHGDVPTEMLVYTQSAPDVPIVADMILRLSRDETAFEPDRSAADITGGHSLPIAMDQNDSVTWPFDWYFRDQRNYTYFTTDQWTQNQTNIIAPNEAVIFASEATENNANFQSFIKGKYTTNKYVLNWWFPEESYKIDVKQPDGSLQSVGDLKTAMDWLFNHGWRYILYRDPGLPLGSRNFYLHVRNDLAVKVGLVPPAAPQAQPTGPTSGLFDLAGSGSNPGQFNQPRGIAIAPDGNFYVVDTDNLRVEKFDPKGKYITSFGSQGSGDGQFQAYLDSSGNAVTGTGPGGVAVDKTGNVYVADTWNHRIEVFDKDGNFKTKWGSFLSLGDVTAASDPDVNVKFYGPRGVAIGPDGNVYVTDTGNKRVMVYDTNGRFVKKLVDSGMNKQKLDANYPFNKPGELNEPMGIAVDGSGNVYVADTVNRRIQKFSNSGQFLTQWAIAAPNWEGSAGSLMEPFLAVDAQGNVYATAPGGKKVLKFSPTGQPLGEKSGQGAVNLNNPTGIAVGSDGTVYVVDTGQHGVINLGKIP